MSNFTMQHREHNVRIDALDSERTAFRYIEDKQFLMMQHTYFRTGGLTDGDDLAQRLRLRSDQPVSTLARWIVDRTVVSFEWQSRTLIPLFQFNLFDMSLRTGTVEVVRELSDVFDAWELASWFAQPNAWLHDEAPADAIGRDQPRVLQAARADRFIVRG